MMNDGKYPPLGSEMDDLPRTLRRERELRERAAREQQLATERPHREPAGTRQMPASQPGVYGTPEPANPYESAYPALDSDTARATVTRIKVPFLSLMGFFIKAVFAAVPALLILIAMLYGLGIVLQQYFPWLIKMKIVISFPG